MRKLLSIKDEAKNQVFNMVQMVTWGLAIGDETSEVIIWVDEEKHGHLQLTCKESKEEELTSVPQNALHIPLFKVVRFNRNGRLVPNKGSIKEIINRWIY